MSLLRRIYHTVVPENIRHSIYYRNVRNKEKLTLDNVISFLESGRHDFPKNDVVEILSFLKSSGLHVFPYSFTRNYKPGDVNVFRDPECGLNYILYKGKRLYAKRNWTEEDVRVKFCFLLNEQDAASPHQYLTDEFNVDSNSVVADVGAAEGIFILPLIENIQHAVLFETDEEWLEALEETFRPYRNKITIVNKFVSDKNDEKHVSLDSYFQGKKVDFIKIDVDGAEKELLDGAVRLLSENQPLKVAICTYHKQEDEKRFTDLMRSKGFRVSASDRFMLFYFDDSFNEPYLRRGLIRCQK